MALSQVGTDFSLMTPLFPNRTRRELKVCGCCCFDLKREFLLVIPVSCLFLDFYVLPLFSFIFLLFPSFPSFSSLPPLYFLVSSFLLCTPSFRYFTSPFSFLSQAFPLSPLLKPSSPHHPLFPFSLLSPSSFLLTLSSPCQSFIPAPSSSPLPPRPHPSPPQNHA